MPVQVEPLKYSPPFGNVRASAETEGFVESTVSVTVPLAEFESLSTAVRRTLKFAVSTVGTVQGTLPPFATEAATTDQLEPPSEEVSTVTGLETGDASEA